MTFYQALLSILLAQPSYYLERPDVTRTDRLEAVAAELAEMPRTVAVALVVQGHWESGWARYVWEGCTEIPRGAPSCDRGRASGYWQVPPGDVPGCLGAAGGL
jgi:hypothetical protein